MSSKKNNNSLLNKYLPRFNQNYLLVFINTFILILGATCYFWGYYLVTVYAFMHLFVRLLQTFSKTFSNKLANFYNDQGILKNHYINDFKICYYFVEIIKVITGCFYIYFFYFLSPESQEQYSFIFFIITYFFILTHLIDLGVIVYIILYKNDPIKEANINLFYYGVVKGLLMLGVLHISSSVVIVVEPNIISNYYHLWSPLGRGYGAYSNAQLIQIDCIKTLLGGDFDYTQCIDDNHFLNQKKILAYAKKNNIDLSKIINDI